jgi:hypothetical protein
METDLFPMRAWPLDVKRKSAGRSSTTKSEARRRDFPGIFAENPGDREKRLIVRRLWIKLAPVALQQPKKQARILWQ